MGYNADNDCKFKRKMRDKQIIINFFCIFGTETVKT